VLLKAPAKTCGGGSIHPSERRSTQITNPVFVGRRDDLAIPAQNPFNRLDPFGHDRVVSAPERADRPMFEQAFKNIDDVLWKEAGCTTELDYTEQTSWLLFLKYLDALEHDKATEARLHGRKYNFILQAPYRWESWAAPKGGDGKIDHNRAMTGDDLRDFVNGKLFPYLHGFTQRASGPNTIEYKIGQIFGEIKNKISSGYNLREIVDHIDEPAQRRRPRRVHQTAKDLHRFTEILERGCQER
jgi:hypothetical protein